MWQKRRYGISQSRSLKRSLLPGSLFFSLGPLTLGEASCPVVEDTPAMERPLWGETEASTNNPSFPAMWVSDLGWGSFCQCSLQMTAAPANIIMATSWEIPSWNHLARLLLNTKPRETIRIINVYFCFNLNFEVICYAAIDNQYTPLRKNFF